MTERALRHNSGKPALHAALCFPEALRGNARVTAYGAAKYARYNFKKGAPASESVDCAMRHLLAWWNGEDTDPESGQSHLDHFVWNAMRLADELQGPMKAELDDRPSTPKPEPAQLSLDFGTPEAAPKPPHPGWREAEEDDLEVWPSIVVLRDADVLDGYGYIERNMCADGSGVAAFVSRGMTRIYDTVAKAKAFVEARGEGLG